MENIVICISQCPKPCQCWIYEFLSHWSMNAPSVYWPKKIKFDKRKFFNNFSKVIIFYSNMSYRKKSPPTLFAQNWTRSSKKLSMDIQTSVEIFILSSLEYLKWFKLLFFNFKSDTLYLHRETFVGHSLYCHLSFFIWTCNPRYFQINQKDPVWKHEYPQPQ